MTMTETYMGRDYMYITPTMTATQDGNKSAPALWWLQTDGGARQYTPGIKAFEANTGFMKWKEPGIIKVTFQ